MEFKLEQIVEDIKSISGIEIEDTSINLIEQGLGSLHVMKLVNKWRKEGSAVTFSKLISNPQLVVWLELVNEEKRKKEKKKKSEGDRYIPYGMTDVQYAYWVGRQENQVLGGVSCHAYMETAGTGIDTVRLNEAWKKLLCHHPMLHTKFDENGKQSEIPDFEPDDIEIYDFSLLEESKAEEKLLEVREKRSHVVRDILHGKNAGLAVSILPNGRQIMHYDIDLLAADVQSFQQVLEDLAALYQGKKISEESSKFDFAQYLMENNVKEDEEVRNAQDFWEKKVESMPLCPQLPLRIRPEEISETRFSTRFCVISNQEWESFKTIAENHKITPAMALLAVYARILERWSLNKKFVINLPVFNRNTQYPGVEKAVADFSNVLLLDCDQSEHQTFAESASMIQQKFHENMEYASYSGMDVVRKLLAHHDLSSCVAPVVFACNLGEPLFSQNVRECFGELYYMLSQTPQVWIDCQVYDYRDGELLIKWDSVDELFPDKLVDRMFASYIDAIHDLAVGKDRWEKELVITAADQENEALRRRNLTDNNKSPKHLLNEFLHNVKEHSDRPAIIIGNMGKEITYGQLYERALKTAATLTLNGMKEKDPVAVILPKSPEQVIAVLGVLLAGGCYVPIGVRQPKERQEKILKNAKVHYILTDSFHQSTFTVEEVSVIAMEETVKASADSNSIRLGKTDDTAYIIFTSGSTGEPKGVEIAHQSAWNTIEDINDRYRVTSEDRVLAVSALDFDLSVYDIFGLLSSGGAIITIEEDDVRDSEKWLSYVNRYEVTLWNSVPAIFDMLMGSARAEKETLKSLRRVFLSGDWIGLDLPKKMEELAPNAQMTAMGGATEASIWSNYHEVKLPLDENWVSIPYGRPLSNQRFNIVDAKGQGCPEWVSGELYIGGRGLAEGYCNNPEKTKSQFIEDEEGNRWYRTGDLGRFRENGIIEFLGRMDDQVKVRGHRIELGEIESALGECQFIEKSLVDTVKDDYGTNHLIAFIVLREKLLNIESAKSAVKEYLQKKVPYYMIPELYKFNEELPLSANGKIDRKVLRDVDIKWELSEKNCVEPKTKTERLLLELWKNVLHLERISRDDNFFELGGDSLQAVKLNSEMKEAFNAEVYLKDIFNYPLLYDQASIIDERKKEHINERLSLEHDEEGRYKPFALTEVQKAYFLGEKHLYEYGDISTHYYFEMMLEDLDTARLEYAVNQVIASQDMLHAVVLEDGEYQQVLKYYPKYRIQEYDAIDEPEEERRNLILYIRDEMEHEHFNSSHLPLFDIRVIRVPDGARVNMCFNNIVFDGASIFLFFELVTKCYRDEAYCLPVPEVSFRDYLLAKEKIKDTAEYQSDKAYWMNRVDSLPMAPELPLESIDTDKSNRLSHMEYILEKKQWEKLKRKIASFGGVTPTVFLITLYAEVLARWSKTKHFTLNMTHFNRMKLHEDIEKIIGDFTSLTMLEVDLSQQDSFLGRCKMQQEQLWEDLDHAAYDGVEVERALIRKKKLKSPVFPYVFTSALGIKNSGNMFTKRLYSCSETPQVWLDHQVSEDNGNLMLALDYLEERFPKGMVDDLWSAYVRTLQAIEADDTLWTKKTPNICSYFYPQKAEKRNDSYLSFKKHLLHSKIVESYKENPHKIAVVDGGQMYSYEDVILMASAVADEIRTYTRGDEECIAIIMPKSVHQVFAAIGILGAGCCYAPIDDGNDTDRKNYIIQNANIKIVLTISSNKEQYEGCSVIYVDQLHKNSNCTLRTQGDDQKRAYIIHTSGSTGVPKGVIINHSGAVNTIEDVNQRLNIGSNDTAIGLSQLWFDLSVYDIFGILSEGGTLIYPDKDRYMDPLHWYELVRKYGVTVWNSVPAFMKMYVDYIRSNELEWTDVENVLLSGDWIGLDLFPAIKEMKSDVKCVSMGGATEASIWSIWYEYLKTDSKWKSIPYGKAMANQQFYVLDENLCECPMMVEGELYIGGAGLALGYLNNENETKNGFVINPNNQQRIYKTGDLGRVMEDGNIEFLGRKDTQVKIMGFRIELGEIDSVISKLEGIRTSVSLALELGGSSKKIYSYVQIKPGVKMTEDELKRKLEKKLPKYMLPVRILFADDIPLTNNGKIDRKEIALLIEQKYLQPEPAPESDFSCNMTSTEQNVAEIMAKALKVDRISLEDDFYDYGADSLIMGNAATELVKLFDEKVPFYEILSTLLNDANVKSAAEIIDMYVEENEMI